MCAVNVLSSCRNQTVNTCFPDVRVSFLASKAHQKSVENVMIKGKKFEHGICVVFNFFFIVFWQHIEVKEESTVDLLNYAPNEKNKGCSDKREKIMFFIEKEIQDLGCSNWFEKEHNFVHYILVPETINVGM